MNGSPSSSAAMAARWVKTGTPEVVNCTRFSITGAERRRRLQPADAPARHRPVLRQRLHEQNLVAGRHDVVERTARGRRRRSGGRRFRRRRSTGRAGARAPGRASSSSRVATKPVGLAGELKKMARVAGVTAAASRSGSRRQRSPRSSGTNTGARARQRERAGEIRPGRRRNQRLLARARPSAAQRFRARACRRW